MERNHLCPHEASVQHINDYNEAIYTQMWFWVSVSIVIIIVRIICWPPDNDDNSSAGASIFKGLPCLASRICSFALNLSAQAGFKLELRLAIRKGKGKGNGKGEGLGKCNQVQPIVAGSLEHNITYVCLSTRKSCDSDDITCYN